MDFRKGLFVLCAVAATAFLVCCHKSASHGSGSANDTDVNTTVTSDTTFQTGGSNYPFYSMGNFLAYGTDSDWFIPYNLRPVIATYHLAPDTVRNQLAVMYANGQRKIALDLWYSDFTSDGSLADSPIYGHVANSKLGRLLPQHEQNLQSLLNDIVHQGFNEILFRWDVQGDSDPRTWTVWQESRYQLNWSFISNTKADIVKYLQGTSIKVIYDLDGELGGCPLGLADQYELRLWQDYVSHYGSHNTVGFSFAVAPQRLTAAIHVWDQVGRRPDIYAFDIYGDEYNTLSYLKSEMVAAGDGNKPVYLEEVYYNDSISDSQIRQARAQLPMDIRFIIQWPLARSWNALGFSVEFAAAYGAYLH